MIYPIKVGHDNPIFIGYFFVKKKYRIPVMKQET